MRLVQGPMVTSGPVPVVRLRGQGCTGGRQPKTFIFDPLWTDRRTAHRLTEARQGKSLRD